LPHYLNDSKNKSIEDKYMKLKLTIIGYDQ